MNSSSALVRYADQVAGANADPAVFGPQRTVGLCAGYTQDPTTGELTPTGEPTSDPAYAPVALPSDATTWNAAAKDATSTDAVVTTKVAPIYFPTPTVDWGTIQYFIVRDGNGNIEAIEPTAGPMNITAGTPVKLISLTFRVSATS